MSGEVGAQIAQEARHSCEDVLRCGEFRGEGNLVVYRARGGRGWEGWRVFEAAERVEERGDEGICDVSVV